MIKQHLIFDADDTLWENNIYFEEAFDRFCQFLDHSALTPAEVRSALDAIEIANNRVHGYGARNFGRNLTQCFETLAERAVEDAHRHHIRSLAEGIFDCPMDLMPGVQETLPKLAGQHQLTLFTKGDSEEQNRKIDRSGLRRYFDHCGVVKEKNVDAYRELGVLRGFDLERTWMIGNSPKSDINPALRAGMRAVFVPHPRTWTLEHEEITEAPGRLLRVGGFTELAELFL
jgi:putative hydrolase of the HAD superfamily